MAVTDRRGVSVDATDTIIAGDPNPGLAIKAPVRVATTAAIILSGLQTIDGVALASGDRVLVKNQADQTTNGLYNASSGNWTRTVDAKSNDQLADGTQVIAASGTLNGDAMFRITTADPIVIGTSNLVFTTVVPSVELPTPTATTLGGIKSLPAISHEYLTSIGTDGLPTQARPVVADLSDAGTFATQNYATPPAIGGTAPAAGTFTTLEGTISNTYNGAAVYQNFGATINRVNDRVLIGGASVNDGLYPNVTKDWLETLSPNSTQLATQATLNPRGYGYAGIFGIRSSDSAVVNGGTNGFAGGFFAVNDDTTALGGVRTTWCNYGESWRTATAAAGAITQGIEQDVINLTGGVVGSVYPYDIVTNLTTAAYWASSGKPGQTTIDATVAYAVKNNGSKFTTAFSVEADAITGTDGVTGTAVAFQFAKGHQIAWYSSGVTTPAWAVYSSAASGTNTLELTATMAKLSSGIASTSPTSGIGYATGAGGTGTQGTNKSTTVTMSPAACMCGQVTMNAAALAAATIVSFTLTNPSIAATDVLILNHISGGTPGAYTLNAQAAAGSATINVRNNTAGSLSEAIVIQFVVIKGVNA